MGKSAKQGEDEKKEREGSQWLKLGKDWIRWGGAVRVALRVVQVQLVVVVVVVIVVVGAVG